MTLEQKNSRRRGHSRINLFKVLLYGFAGVILAFLVVPAFMSLPMSFTSTQYLVFPPKGFSLKWYNVFLTDEDWVKATLLSLRVAFLSSAFSLIIGTLGALVLVRGSLPGKRILNMFFISPMMIPTIIIAFAAYGLIAKLGLIGSTTGMVLAHSVICIPFVILVVSANLYRLDISLELAARNLGANAFKAFLYVAFPMIKMGIIAAGIFCFITSLDELVIAMFVIGTTKMTLPIKIFSQIQVHIFPVVAAASSVFVFASIAIVISLAFLRRR